MRSGCIKTPAFVEGWRWLNGGHFYLVVAAVLSSSYAKPKTSFGACQFHRFWLRTRPNTSATGLASVQHTFGSQDLKKDVRAPEFRRKAKQHTALIVRNGQLVHAVQVTLHRSHMGFAKSGGYLLEGVSNKDYSILGSMFGSPYLGNYHIDSMTTHTEQ